MKHDYIFLLGREIALSLAELRSVFTDVQTFWNFALIHEEGERLMSLTQALWGTIKIGRVLSKDIQKQHLLETITQQVKEKVEPGKKLRIGIDSFVPAFSSLVFKIKDALKAEWASIRVVQHEWWRIKTATTLHEKLVSQGIECMIIPTQEKNGYILAETVFVQDIDAYTKRDMERERSMVVGMMPPKIAQIMINLGTKGNREVQIWDSFCGLGTTIIEAWSAGYRNLVASDVSEAMVKVTKTNIEKIGWNCIVFRHDAQELDTYILPLETVIVTEGMLGKNFTTSTITHTEVMKERTILTTLYSNFFQSALNNPRIQSIVCCLPFWNSGKDTFFMPQVSEMATWWSVNPLCRDKKRFLQHIRPGQCVGREIVILDRVK